MDITVLRLDNLGDHVLGSGLFKALRDLYPDSHITAVVPSKIVPLYLHCPYLDVVTDQVEKESADLVINPRFAEDYYKAGLVAVQLARFGADIIGFKQVNDVVLNYTPNGFYSQLLEVSDTLHASTYIQVLARELGSGDPCRPQVWYSPDDKAAVMRLYGLTDGFSVIGTGASGSYKLPKQETFDYVASVLPGQVVCVGTAGEYVPRGSIDTTGKLPIPVLTALIAGCKVYAGPDAGPKHIAAALDKPVLELGWWPHITDGRRFTGHSTARGPGCGGSCWEPYCERFETVNRPHERADIDAALRSLWQRTTSACG